MGFLSNHCKKERFVGVGRVDHNVKPEEKKGRKRVEKMRGYEIVA